MKTKGERERADGLVEWCGRSGMSGRIPSHSRGSAGALADGEGAEKGYFWLVNSNSAAESCCPCFSSVLSYRSIFGTNPAMKVGVRVETSILTCDMLNFEVENLSIVLDS